MARAALHRSDTRQVLRNASTRPLSWVETLGVPCVRSAPLLAHGTPNNRDGRPLDDTDESFMLRIKEGDRDAFRAALDRHLGSVVACARRMLGDSAAAEDVAQETFLRLWTNAPRWQPTARLSTWLHRVAVNLCLDRLRRTPTTSLDDIPEPPDPQPSAAAQLQAHDIGRRVGAAVAALPVQQRIAITLCHYEGLGNIEAAAMMAISVEALESLLARGRRTLRARLRNLLPELLAE